MTETAMPTLDSVCELIVDSEHKTAPTQSEGHPLVRTPNIGRGRFILDNAKRVSEDIYKIWTRRAVPRMNDLILAREAPVGNVARVPANLKPVLGQRTVLIRPDKSKVEPAYLAYLLLGDEIQGTIQSLSTGATVAHLNMSDIRNLKVPILPPLPTQRKIASVLSTYDDLIENNTRRIEVLEEMAQSIYREWFVHFRFPGHKKVEMVSSDLGPIPKGWEVVSFTEIADVLSGGTPKTTVPEYWNGDIPFFAPKDAPTSYYVLETEKTITEVGLEKCNSKLYPKDTVFITARGTVGKVVIPAVDMAMNQSCYALKGRNGISQYFVFMAIMESVRRLQQEAHGAVFDTIIVDTFRRLRVVKPPLSVVEQFDDFVVPIFEETLNLLRKNSNLRRTRDLLLPKLISGEVDVEQVETKKIVAELEV